MESAERTFLVPPTCTLMAEHIELTKQILLDQMKLRVQKNLHQEFSAVTSKSIIGAKKMIRKNTRMCNS